MKALSLKELLAHRLEALTTEHDELEIAGKVAAQNGMQESGATLRNRAAGIKRALDLITPILTTVEPQ